MIIINQQLKKTQKHIKHMPGQFFSWIVEKKHKTTTQKQQFRKTQKHTKHMPGPFFSWIKKNTKKHIKHMGLVTWSKTCYPKKNTKTHKTHINKFF